MIRKIKVSLLFGEKRGKPYLTFFLSDEKESKQRKNRRHRFIGQSLNHNICG